MATRHGEEVKNETLKKLERLQYLGTGIDFCDAMVFAVLVPNMNGLYLLAPKVTKELQG